MEKTGQVGKETIVGNRKCLWLNIVEPKIWNASNGILERIYIRISRYSKEKIQRENQQRKWLGGLGRSPPRPFQKPKRSGGPRGVPLRAKRMFSFSMPWVLDP